MGDMNSDVRSYNIGNLAMPLHVRTFLSSVVGKTIIGKLTGIGTQPLSAANLTDGELGALHELVAVDYKKKLEFFSNPDAVKAGEEEVKRGYVEREKAYGMKNNYDPNNMWSKQRAEALAGKMPTFFTFSGGGGQQYGRNDEKLMPINLTLGRFGYKILPDGTAEIRDTYDFNADTDGYKIGEGVENFVRGEDDGYHLGQAIGHKMLPEGEGRKVRINLGDLSKPFVPPEATEKEARLKEGMEVLGQSKLGVLARSLTPEAGAIGIDKAAEGGYASAGYQDGSWNEQQYSYELKQSLLRLGRSALKEVSWMMEQLDRPAQSLMRDDAGKLARTLDDLNIWHPDWDDPVTRQFGWHNVPLLAATAAVPWSIAKAAYKYPELLVPTGNLKVGGGMGPFWMKAHEIYSEVAPTFGKTHPKVVDEIVKAFGADPLLLLGPAMEIAKAPGVARDIFAIERLVVEARKTGYATDALVGTYGRPITAAVVKAIKNKKNTPTQAAEILFARGFRPVDSSTRFLTTELGVTQRYFRKAGDLIPPEMRDLWEELPHIKEAAWREHKAALKVIKQAVKDIDPQDVEDIARILDAIPRPKWMTAKQHGQLIRSEMAQRVLTGNFAYTSLDHAPSAKAIEAAAIYGEMTKLGYAEKAPYLINYSPGHKRASGMTGPFEGLATGHRKQRLLGVNLEKNFEELQKWAYGVFVREGKPGNTKEAANAFLEKAETAMTGLIRPKLEEAPSIVRFRVELDARLSTLKAAKGAAEKAAKAAKNVSDLQQAEQQIARFEAAITETGVLVDAIIDIGKKNPEVLEDPDLMKDVVTRVLKYIRMSQTIGQPGWYGGNFMEGAARAALATGEVDLNAPGAFIRGHSPIRGIDGSLMDLTHGNIQYQSGELKGVAQSLGAVSDRIDRYYQGIVGGIEYEARVAFYRGKGELEGAVHEFAKADAIEKVKTFFPDLRNSSKFIDDLSPAFTYLKHNVYFNTEPLLKWAFSRPSEAVFYDHMLQVQHDSVHSDRYGNLHVPGTDRAVNPLNLTGARRLARLVMDPSSVIGEGDAPAVRVMKLAQVGTGSLVAPIHWLQRQAGLISEHSPDVGLPQLEVANDMARHLAGIPLATIAKGLVTGKVEETKEFFRELGINKYIASEKLPANEPVRANGAVVEPTTVEQASTRYDKVNGQNGEIKFLTGIDLEYRTDNMDKLDALIDHHDNVLSKYPDAAIRQEQMRNDIPALNGVVTVYQAPEDKIRNMVERIKNAEIYDAKVPELKETTELERSKLLKAAPTGVYEKLMDLWGKGLKKVSEVGEAIKENVSSREFSLVGTAQAASTDTVKPPDPNDALTKNGKFITTVGQKKGVDSYLGAHYGNPDELLKMDMGLATHLDTTNAIKHIYSGTSNQEVLTRLAQYDAGRGLITNFVKDPQNRKDDVNARIARVIEDPDTADGTMPTITSRKAVADSIRDYAMKHGLGIKTMSHDQVLQLAGAGKMNMSSLTLQALDPSAVRAGQLELNPNAVSMARKEKNDQVYPGDELLRSRLQRDIQKDPGSVSATIDDIGRAISLGYVEVGEQKIPVNPAWWEDTRGLSGQKDGGYPGIFEQAAVMDDWGEIVKLKDRISITSLGDRSPNPRTLAINIPALEEAIKENPANGVRAAMMRAGVFGNDFATRMEMSGARYDSELAQLRDHGFDPKYEVKSFDAIVPKRRDADLLGVYNSSLAHSAGIEKNAFAEALAAPLAPAPAPSTGVFQKVIDSPLAHQIAGKTLNAAIDSSVAGIERAPENTVRSAALSAEIQGVPGVKMGPGLGGFLPQPKQAAPLLNTLGHQESRLYPSPAGKAAEITAGANTYHPDFRNIDIAGQFKHTESLPSSMAGRGLEVPTQRYSSSFALVADVYRQSALTGNSTKTTFGALLRMKDSNGVPVSGPDGLSVSPGELIGAATMMAQTGAAISGNKDQMVTAGITSASFAATAAVKASPLLTIPVYGWIAYAAVVVTAAVVGFFAGGGFKKKADNAQSDHMGRVRVEQRIEQEKIDSARRDQSATRELADRESVLSKSISTMTSAQRALIAPQLAKYQRRPTFQSRVGLVDVAERAVGSALKPRW